MHTAQRKEIHRIRKAFSFRSNNRLNEEWNIWTVHSVFFCLRNSKSYFSPRYQLMQTFAFRSCTFILHSRNFYECASCFLCVRVLRLCFHFSFEIIFDFFCHLFIRFCFFRLHLSSVRFNIFIRTYISCINGHSECNTAKEIW